jgi:hypothetical protein
MSCSFFLRNEISFEAIKPFGFFHEYDKENDANLIVSKRQVCSVFNSQYHKNEIIDEHYNYLRAHMGPNGGFEGFTRYGVNNVEVLIHCLTEELNIRVVSEDDFDNTFFVDAIIGYFDVQKMSDSEELDILNDLVSPIITADDYIDLDYEDFDKLSDWVERNLIEIKEKMIEYGISFALKELEG